MAIRSSDGATLVLGWVEIRVCRSVEEWTMTMMEKKSERKGRDINFILSRLKS